MAKIYKRVHLVPTLMTMKIGDVLNVGVGEASEGATRAAVSRYNSLNGTEIKVELDITKTILVITRTL